MSENPESRKMKMALSTASASILGFCAIPRPQMVWDGKRSPIKFLIIISPAELRVVAEGLGQGGGVMVCVCGKRGFGWWVRGVQGFGVLIRQI